MSKYRQNGKDVSIFWDVPGGRSLCSVGFFSVLLGVRCDSWVHLRRLSIRCQWACPFPCKECIHHPCEWHAVHSHNMACWRYTDSRFFIGPLRRGWIRSCRSIPWVSCSQITFFLRFYIPFYSGSCWTELSWNCTNPQILPLYIHFSNSSLRAVISKFG